MSTRTLRLIMHFIILLFSLISCMKLEKFPTSIHRYNTELLF